MKKATLDILFISYISYRDGYNFGIKVFEDGTRDGFFQTLEKV